MSNSNHGSPAIAVSHASGRIEDVVGIVAASNDVTVSNYPILTMGLVMADCTRRFFFTPYTPFCPLA